jgi:hypothetical protein
VYSSEFRRRFAALGNEVANDLKRSECDLQATTTKDADASGDEDHSEDRSEDRRDDGKGARPRQRENQSPQTKGNRKARNRRARPPQCELKLHAQIYVRNRPRT